MGFYLLRTRSKRHPFEAHDYFTYDRRQARRTSASDDYYRRRKEINGSLPWSKLTKAMLILVVVSLIVAMVAAAEGFFEGLVLFLLLPVILGLIRSRREARQRETPDES